MRHLAMPPLGLPSFCVFRWARTTCWANCLGHFCNPADIPNRSGLEGTLIQAVLMPLFNLLSTSGPLSPTCAHLAGPHLYQFSQILYAPMPSPLPLQHALNVAWVYRATFVRQTTQRHP